MYVSFFGYSANADCIITNTKAINSTKRTLITNNIIFNPVGRPSFSIKKIECYPPFVGLATVGVDVEV